MNFFQANCDLQQNTEELFPRKLAAADFIEESDCSKLKEDAAYSFFRNCVPFDANGVD